MGAGIAQTALEHGFAVRLYDITPMAAGVGRGRIETGLARLVDRGKLEPAARDLMLARLALTTSLKELGVCEVIVEAVPEDLDLKRRVFAELDRVSAETALLAGNT